MYRSLVARFDGNGHLALNELTTVTSKDSFIHGLIPVHPLDELHSCINHSWLDLMTPVTSKDSFIHGLITFHPLNDLHLCIDRILNLATVTLEA